MASDRAALLHRLREDRARARRIAEAARRDGHPDLGRVRARRSEARVSRRPTLADVSRYGSAWLLVVAGGVLAVVCVSSRPPRPPPSALGQPSLRASA